MVARKVVMPQLGESVTEGTITSWLVRPGDYVKKYDPLCEVSTDKVNAEVPSTVEGRVVQIVAGEGDTLAVGDLLCYIEETGTDVAITEARLSGGEREGGAGTLTAERGGEMKKRYSPAVLKLAREHNLDLQSIAGTGKGGRITRKDVLAALEAKRREKELAQARTAASQPADPLPAATQTRESQTVLPPLSGLPAGLKAEMEQGDEAIAVTEVRKAIAQRMTYSKREIPHAWTMVEADVSKLVRFREGVKEEFKRKEGFPLTYLPFFIKAVVESLKEYPCLNAVWEGERIVLKKRINISVAIATDDALYVPVIHDADQKSVYGLAKELNRLITKTREGNLALEDISGGTFTVNNTGAFGSILSMPIINPPQAAIISLESIVKRPVVIDDMIAIRSMVNLCISFDHRVLDGLVCGRFLQTVKRRLEGYGPGMNLY
ncbi:branched-chain alpha-keto dehydrogenase complex dihydrolipoyllysine-residue (2-methylpropanoyl)transferase [Bacillaceae bacterium]